MKLLIVDPEGLGALDLAMRAQRDGHEVRYFIKETPHTALIGKGLTKVVRDFKPWLRWADLVFVADNTKYLRDLDAARREGVNVVGPSQEAAEWELDRQVGMQIFRKCGIAIPPYKAFRNYGEAIAYVKKANTAFVSKPSTSQDKTLSYVAQTPAELVYMLERWKRAAKPHDEFILQEKLDGIEMGVGGWFGPNGWCAGWEENWEFKKLMDGDMGVATGEQGTVMRFVRKSKLADKVLVPLTEELERLNYIGNLDVNCIIDSAGVPWPLEFTMRPGWPAFNIQDALTEGDSVQWLFDLSQGKDTRRTVMDTIAMGVVLSIPDYPYSHLTQKQTAGIPIYGIKQATWQHLHPAHMMLATCPTDSPEGVVDLPVPATAGDYVLIMTATGETVLDAKRLCYARLKRLTVPNSPMWRTDIGDRLAKQIPLLQEKGYARNLLFSTPQ